RIVPTRQRIVKKSLYAFELEQLKKELTAHSMPGFAGMQIFKWIYKQGKYNTESWSNVSQKVKSYIQQNMDMQLPKVIRYKMAKDGTLKFLIALKDNKTVEMVVIFSKNRTTLCISTQIGCAIGCTFCHTATMGFERNLTVEEIVGQFLLARQWLQDRDPQEKKINNIVYMGQGEPLLNFTNVNKATNIFMQEQGLGIGQRKITLSTSGLVPQMEKLDSFPPINIAISLHATQNTIRTRLIPINRIYNLEKLFETIKKIPLKAHRYITYEYLLIAGLNDRKEDILGLDRLIEKKKSKINLIPFNEYPQAHYKKPSEQKTLWFKDQLIKLGHVCTVRETKGEDILAACGQLKAQN
ncbi:MAG: 23S rRNA (adenine(2503)-C(2))-methyltransferase RlmN, partial [Halobacteriovoraceae bacterium]|nr:23S rRNA (adenine(2503)-C(2))-methyltransferase RlmN [Halobacteriovoraceae bacterium]